MCRLLVQPLPRTPPGRQRKWLTSPARGARAARGGAGARVRGLRGQVRAHPSEQGEHAGENRLPEATGDTDAGKQKAICSFPGRSFTALPLCQVGGRGETENDGPALGPSQPILEPPKLSAEASTEPECRLRESKNKI